MKDPKKLRELLLDYKLGHMKQQLRERFDERVFNEPEFSALLEEAEFDLLDDYHAGRLSVAERERVEQAFSSAERDRAIPIPAQRFAQAAAAPRRKGMFLPAFALSLSAFVIAGIFFITHHAAVRSSIGSAEGSAPSGRMAALPPSVDPRSEVASLLLTAEVVRGDSAMQLRLTPKIRTVRIQWVVPAETTGSLFSLRVVEAPGTTRAIVESVRVATLDGRRVAEFSIPANAFRGSGDRYLLSVRPEEPSAAALREYHLTVDRR